MTAAQSLSATAKTIPVSFHYWLAEVVEEAKYEFEISTSKLVAVVFQDPPNPVPSLAKEPFAG